MSLSFEIMNTFIFKIITSFTILFVCQILLITDNEQVKKPLFCFGILTDCQYSKKISNVRNYNLSPKRLRFCLEGYDKTGNFIESIDAIFIIIVIILKRLYFGFGQYH